MACPLASREVASKEYNQSTRKKYPNLPRPYPNDDTDDYDYADSNVAAVDENAAAAAAADTAAADNTAADTDGDITAANTDLALRPIAYLS